MPTYSYGGFNLSDQVNYFIVARDFSTVMSKQTLFKIARQEGMKKTGEVWNERTFTLTMKVIGSSRADLESKLDALENALLARQQQLLLHSVDGRYWIADCTGVKASVGRGSIVSCQVTVSFTAQQPWLFAPGMSQNGTNNMALAFVSGTTWQTGNFQVTGGGNVYARPTITLKNNSSANNNTLAEPVSPAVNTTVSASTLANATSITVAASTGLTGSGTVVLDVSPGTANQETAIFTIPATGTGPFTLAVNASYNGGHLKNAHTSGDTIRSVALPSGTAVTSLPISALAAAAVSGQQFVLSYTDPVLGAQTATVTTSAAAAAGVTSLPINSFTPSSNFPAGATTVNFAAVSPTAFTLSESPDGVTLTVSGLGANWAPGTTITINSDPTSVNGYAVIGSWASNTPLNFSGLFPLVQPTTTTFNLQVTATTQPLVDMEIGWTARWQA